MRTLASLLALSLVLVACSDDGADSDDDDADGDGFDVQEDCDDSDPDVFPGAEERCNEIDDDCDDEVDEQAVDKRTFYADDDGDGYGNSSNQAVECFAPEGFVEQGDDCDDQDASRNPGEVEICNDVDDDCNGRVDDEPTDGSTWYPDADRDGWGGDAGAVQACSPVAGHLPSGGDCDDSDELINPDGQEVCDPDGEDEDCDGLVNDADDSMTQGKRWYVDADEDGYGDRDTPIIQCEQPADRIANGEDCRDDLPEVNPEGTEICGNDIDDDCDDHAASCGVEGWLDVDLADSTWEGYQSGAAFGSKVLGLPDRTGDGRNELIIAQGRWDTGRDPNYGRVHVVSGPALGGSVRITDHQWTSATANRRFGRDVVVAGDVDGDGEPEVWISDADTRTGSVVLIDATEDLEDAPLYFSDASPWDELGASLAALQDVTGDDVADLVVGVPRRIGGDGVERGGAFVASGDLTEDTRIGDVAHATLEGAIDFGRCGEAVLAFDADGDGTQGVVVGCPSATVYKGAVSVFADVPSGVVSLDDADVGMEGLGTTHGAGAALASGDLDGDGYDDLIVGSPGAGGSLDRWAGAAYVLAGPVESSDDLSTATRTWQGEFFADEFGGSISTGDTDGDGLDEVLIGAHRWSINTGRSYLLDWDTGSSGGAVSATEGVAVISGDAEGDTFGVSGAIVPDLDDDGYDDVVIAAPNAFVTASGAGIVWIWRGGEGF